MNFLQMSSYKTAAWMTIAVSIVGFAILIGGAVLTGLAYTEVRPNYADENYNRYMGANLQRTVGPIMLTFGLLLLVGACAFFGFIIFAKQRHLASKNSSISNVRREAY